MRDRHSRSIEAWILVVVVLAATNGLVATRLTNALLRPKWENPTEPLRDRTNGQHVHYVFDILDVTYRPETPYVFIVGDSTVAIGMPKPKTSLPFHLQKAIREAGLPAAKVVDLSQLGLHAQDALILVAEAMTYAPVVVLYAINPRIFSIVSGPELLTADRAAPLVGAAGSLRYLPFSYLIHRYGFEDVAASFSTSHLSVARFAPPVRQATWESCHARWPGGALEYLCEVLVRPVDTEPPIQPPPVFHKYVSDRTQIDFDNSNTRAFEMLVALCRETDRCLLYETPLNPECPIQFEPGLVDDAKAYLARVVDERVPMIDLSDALGPEMFRAPMYRDCDGLHPSDQGNVVIASRLADEALRVIAARSSGFAPPPASPHERGRS